MELRNRLHKDTETEEFDKRYLTFWTDGQLFGLHIADVVQITQMQEIMGLPEQPSYVRGIINLRGQIIPVIDVRLRFGKQEAAFSERTCIIIANVRESDFGLIVDAVDEVVDISTEQISEPPKIGANANKAYDYLTGIAILKANNNQKVVLLLDAAKIFGEAEFNSISQATEDLI